MRIVFLDDVCIASLSGPTWGMSDSSNRSMTRQSPAVYKPSLTVFIQRLLLTSNWNEQYPYTKE